MNAGIILIIRYLFYCSIGFITHFIRLFLFSFYHKYNNYNVKHKAVAVCGRGLSANEYFIYAYKKHTKVFLANYKNEDLKFNDYFKLINKELVLVSNIVEVMPNILLLFLINLKEIIISQPNKQMQKGIRKSKRSCYKLNLLGVKVRGVETSRYLDIYSKNKHLNKIGTGIYAIYEAAEFAMKNNIKKVYLYGYDFYSGPKNKLTLLEDDFSSEEQYLAHRSDYIHLSEALEYLVRKYPKLEFFNNTFNPYKFKSLNLKTIIPKVVAY